MNLIQEIDPLKVPEIEIADEPEGDFEIELPGKFEISPEFIDVLDREMGAITLWVNNQIVLHGGVLVGKTMRRILYHYRNDPLKVSVAFIAFGAISALQLKLEEYEGREQEIEDSSAPES